MRGDPAGRDSRPHSLGRELISVRGARRVLAGVAIVAGTSLGPTDAVGQAAIRASGTLTRAELTDGLETSTQADVERVLRAAAATDRMYLTRLGYSEEGRPLHMVVWGDVDGPEPSRVRAPDAIRVLVFGNIHAGEVAGKEAALMLVRDLAAGAHPEWADSLVLLIVPNYNADGNERVGLRNRRLQHGPVGGMGRRSNATGLDLNRDNMKLESAEARSLVRALNEFDPHVILDLHTTNGTVHAYHLTYSPPLHPDTPDAIDRLLREDWLPSVTSAIRDQTGWETYYYGNVPRPREGGDGPERGWYTFSYQPRFTTNYFGLRNRFGILSEAYSYASFPDRIEATRQFVEEVISWAHANPGAIRAAIEEAENESVVGRELTLGAEFERTDSVTVLLGDVTREPNPYTGEEMLLRTDVQIPEAMPEFGRFRSTRKGVAPAAYLLPSSLDGIAALLVAHGIEHYRTQRPVSIEAEAFMVDSVASASREFQGHRQTTVTGAWQALRTELPVGTLVIPMEQPLARLAFALLEPTTTDGLVNWNFLDAELAPGRHAPVLRVMTLPAELDRPDG